MQKVIIQIIYILSITCFCFIGCSSVRLTPKEDTYLCSAFENDSIDMLQKYFEQWSSDIQPISISEKMALNDTVKIVYKIFEDYENYWINSGLRNFKKPYTMIQNEINYSISNLKSFTYEPFYKIEMLSLQPLAYNNLIKPASFVIDKETLISKIKYPQIAVRAGIKGDITVEFLVDTLGTPQNIKIIRGIGAGCDEAVLFALYSSKFIPAKINGKNVEQKMLITFRFILHNEELANHNLNLKKSIIKKGIIKNFRPLPNRLPNKPVYVTEAKKSSLNNFIRSDCGDCSEEKYNNQHWKGWPRANFIEQMTKLNAGMMAFHFHSIPYIINIVISSSFNNAYISACNGSSYTKDLFELKNNKWLYIKTISVSVE